MNTSYILSRLLINLLHALKYTVLIVGGCSLIFMIVFFIYSLSFRLFTDIEPILYFSNLPCDEITFLGFIDIYHQDVYLYMVTPILFGCSLIIYLLSYTTHMVEDFGNPPTKTLTTNTLRVNYGHRS